MTITTFDKPTAKALGAEVARELAALAARHGLTVDYAGGSLDTLDFTMKLRFRVNDPKAAEAHARQEWDSYATMLGLAPAAFGAHFYHKREMYRITGCLPSRPKFCVKARHIHTGKELLFPASVTHRTTAMGEAQPDGNPFAAAPVPPAPPAPGADTAKAEWDRDCRAIGLKPEHFGQTFIFAGKPFTVCGIRLGKKRPVVARSARGTEYVFYGTDMLAGLQTQQAA